MKVCEDLTTLSIHQWTSASKLYQDRKKSYTRYRGSRKTGLAGEAKQKFRRAKVFLSMLDVRKCEINRKRLLKGWNFAKCFLALMFPNRQSKDVKANLILEVFVNHCKVTSVTSTLPFLLPKPTVFHYRLMPFAQIKRTCAVILTVL